MNSVHGRTIYTGTGVVKDAYVTFGGTRITGISGRRRGKLVGSFPVVMKEGLRLVGIDAGVTLPPIKGLSEEKRRKLADILKTLGVYGVRG